MRAWPLVSCSNEVNEPEASVFGPVAGAGWAAPVVGWAGADVVGSASSTFLSMNSACGSK
jgi:hypothetical protein